MTVSHETIYRSLFVQSPGALRKELAAGLRTGRTRRRPHGHKDPCGYIKDMLSILERPAKIQDRSVPGHWEGDLIVGSLGKSAIVTLVERQTRYLMLPRIGRDKTTDHACAAITNQANSVSTPACRSISVTRTHPGSGDRVKIPPGCSDTFPKGTDWQLIASQTRTRSLMNSTIILDKL